MPKRYPKPAGRREPPKKSPPGKAAPSKPASPRAGLWVAIICALLSLATYLPTTSYEFVWDDLHLISENRSLQATSPLTLFARNYWHTSSPVPIREMVPYYRPLVTLSFWTDLVASGEKAQPWRFHLTNILLAALAAGLFAWLSWELFGSLWLALLAGLAFTLHPMHAESAAFVSGRTDLWLGLFVFAGLIALLGWVRRPHWAWLPAGVVCASGAMLSKESGAVSVLLALIILLLERKGKLAGRDWVLLTGLGAVTVLYFLLRQSVLGGGIVHKEGRWFLTSLGLVPNLLGLYLKMFLFPFRHQALIPQGSMPTGLSWLGLFGMAFVAGAVYALWRWKVRQGGIGLTLALLLLLPVLGVLPLGITDAAERLLYVPSAGLILLAAALLEVLARKGRPLSLAIGILVGGYVVAMGIGTLRREGVWRDRFTLFAAMVREAPAYAMPRVNLGTILMDAGDLRGARGEFEEAIRLQPEVAEGHFSLGLLLRKAGEPRGAAEAFERAAKRKPGWAQAHDKLGIALRECGDLAGAIQEYRRAIELDPLFPEAHNNLGVALVAVGDTLAAMAEYQKAIHLNPEYAEAHSNLGLLLGARGLKKEEVRELETAVRLEPGLAQAHYNLATALDGKGDLSRAAREYEEAVRLAPDFTAAYNNLGTVYKKQGDTLGAIRQYRTALAIQPNFLYSLYNLTSLYLAMGKTDSARYWSRRADSLFPQIPEIHALYQQAWGRP